MSNRFGLPRALAAIALALLGGCAAQMKPVADFGAAANHLATAYKPFTSGLADSCEQKRRYVALSAPGAYDDEIVARDAATSCANARQAGAQAAALGDGVAAYANALVKLSGAKPTVFDSNISHVGSKLGDVKVDGVAVVDSSDLGLATKALRATAVLVDEGKLQVLTRETLRDNHGALVTVVNAMKRYASGVYAPQLADTRTILLGEHDVLIASSRAATPADVAAALPARLAQPAMRADIDANKLEAERVAAFDKAADALVAAHADLVANFDTLAGVEKLELVSTFVAKVQAIKERAAAL